MSKATKQIAAAATAATVSKQPTVVANENAAIEYALDPTIMRSRPVVAINSEGKLVVCCKTTAKKHGWEVQGKLYARIRSGKEVEIAAPAKAVKATPAATKKAPAKSMKAKLLSQEVSEEVSRLLGM